MQLTLCAIILAAMIGAPVYAADPALTTGRPDSALVDAIIRKMEDSGALDAVVDRAIDRYVQRKEMARKTEEAQKQAALRDLAKHSRPVDVKQDHIRGKSTAEVSLIEYTDFECPYCKAFHATPKVLLERFDGRVNWVIRNYPLTFHEPAASKESLAAECVARLAGNDAYWKYADSLYANTKSNGGGLPEDKSVGKLAEAVGIKSAALAQCMNDGAMSKRIEDDLGDGRAAGVSGTPMTIVRDNRTGASEAIEGARPADFFVPIIQRILNVKP